MKKWTPYISLDCEGQIWNILPGYDSRILLEVRGEHPNIHYFEVDLEMGISKKLALSSVPWWSQAVFYAPPYLLVQEYDDEQNPDNVRLHLYNSDTLAWTREAVRFEEFQEGNLLLKDLEGKMTKVPLREYSNRTSFEFPWHYSEGEEYFNDVAGFLKDEVTPVRAIDYFENEDVIIFSFYQQQEKSLRLSLMVLNTTGDILLQDVLDENLSGIADPTFLISKRNVIFVKEKRHFFVYRIAH